MHSFSVAFICPFGSLSLTWINFNTNMDKMIKLCCYVIRSTRHPQGGRWLHDDVIKWKHSPRNWPFVRRIHRSPVNSPHKGQWRGALMFPLICVWINDWVNNSEAGDLRRYQAHYDVTVMSPRNVCWTESCNYPVSFLFCDVKNTKFNQYLPCLWRRLACPTQGFGNP